MKNTISRVLRGMQNYRSILVTLFIITVLAAFLRFGWILISPPWPLLWDALGYHHTALRILHWNTFAYSLQAGPVEPNAFSTPGYPLLVAAVYALGKAQFTVYLLQALLSTVTVLLVALTAYRVGKERSMWLAGISLALYPPAWIASNCLLTETVYTFGATCMACGLLLWKDNIAQARSTSWCIGMGVGGGLLALVRPHGILLSGLFLFAILIDRTIEWRRRFFQAAAVFLAVCLVLSPWWIRNIVVLDHLVLSSLGAANPFFAGVFLSQDAYNAWIRDNWTPAPDPYTQQKQQIQHAFQAMQVYFEKDGLGYIGWWLVGKPIRLFWPPWLPSTAPLPALVLGIAYLLHAWGLGALFITTLLTVLIIGKRPCTLRQQENLLWFMKCLTSLFAVNVFLYWITLPLPRYLFPVMPLGFLGGACLCARTFRADSIGQKIYRNTS